MKVLLSLLLCTAQILAVQIASADLTQNNYRWYYNVDSTDPTAAIAAENTDPSISAASTTPMHLRMNVTTTGTGVATGTQALRLQSAFSTSGPWADVTDPWWDTTMSHRRRITIGSTTAALTDFPLPVFLYSSTTASNLVTNIDYTKTQNSGQDIRFATASGTPLRYEIERWNETATSTIWVKIPSTATSTVDSIVSTPYIWMYYNNTSTSSAATTTGVWNSNYAGVWHMNNQTSGSGAFTDSAGVAQNGTGFGTIVLASTTGKTAGAWQFDKTTAYVSMANTADLNPTSLTLSGWWYRTGDADDGGFAGKWGGSQGYLLWSGGVCCSNANQMTGAIDGGNDTSSGITAALNTWYHWLITYTPSTLGVYVDGTLRASDTSATLTNTTGTFEIGRYAQAGGFGVAGIIDEVRLSNVVRSAAWVLAEFNSTHNPNFNTYGPEESYATTTVWRFANATSSPIATDNATTTTLLLTGSDRNESYEEASTTPGFLNALAVNEDGEFDFYLDPTQATTTNTYYFRAIRATTTTALDTYTRYPTLTFGASNPTFTQRNYRWFLNENGIQPGSPKKSLNTAITSVDTGNLNRLRMDMSVATANLGVSGQAFILQYKTLGGGCAAAESWTSVGNATSSAIWRSHVNSNATNGAAITSALLDSNNILGSYNDIISSTFTNPNAINTGQAGEWDWTIYNNGGVANTSYCFRMAKTGGDVAAFTFTNYAQLTTAVVASAIGSGSGSDEITPVETPSTGGTGTGGGSGSGGESAPPETPSTGGSGGGGGGEGAFLTPLRNSVSSMLASVFSAFERLMEMWR